MTSPASIIIRDHLQSRYAGWKAVRVRQSIETICVRHLELGLADPNFAQELCCGDNARYWQRLSEALFAHHLLEGGLDVRPSRRGPDLMVVANGRNVWVEVICPLPVGISEEWLTSPPGVAVSMPHEAILLRWTAGIAEKSRKLLGDPTHGQAGYLAKGRVGPTDAYVIAVNGRMLRSGLFPQLAGISQFPFAVEAVFPVGPYALQIDRQTRKTVGAGHQHRPVIPKPSGANVPTQAFLDPTYGPVSAIWAADLDETEVLGNPQPTAVVHNPSAINALPRLLLPAQNEYVAIDQGTDAYLLERRPGRLA